MFGIAAKSSFGIDIGTQTIKLTEVRKKGNMYHLVNYATWSDALDDVVQDKNGNRDSSSEIIAEILNVMIQQAKMDIQKMYIAIPSYLAFSTTVEFPVMSSEDLANAIHLQAKQYIPVPIEEVQVDWINLGLSPDKKTVQVLLMAIPNTVISKYLKISQLAGIEVEGFELDIFSQMRATHMEGSPACLVDIGARSSSIGIFDKDKRLSLLRSFDVGGNHVTNAIADQAGVSVEEGESMKVKFGVTGENQYVVSGVDSTLRKTIIRDLSLVLQEYEQKSGIRVNQVIIIGGMSHMRGMTQYMKSCLVSNNSALGSLEVSIGQPSSKIGVRSEFSETFRSKVWQDISLALGIALK